MFRLTAFAGIVAVALIFGGFYWTRRQGLLSGQATEKKPSPRRISRLTEAVGYIGAILILAGGIAAVGQRWHGIPGWGRVAVLAGAAAVFLLAGLVMRGVREPAIQRLTDVVWFLSVAGAAGATGFAADALGSGAAVTALAVGAGISVCSAALWLARRHALENFALFTGLIVTICSAIFILDATPPSLAFAIALWGFGLVWAALGWQRYLEPVWVSVPSGVLLSLIVPSIAAGEHGWVYALGIGTAAGAMAASVRLRNTPLLALGSLAMFGYVASVVLQYFHRSLGAPGALAITGVLILGLAVATARLMRAAHPAKAGEAHPAKAAHPVVRAGAAHPAKAAHPVRAGAAHPAKAAHPVRAGEAHPARAGEPDAAAPPPLAHLPGRREPGAGNPAHRDLPRAS
jgi:hypothetical protein